MLSPSHHYITPGSLQFRGYFFVMILMLYRLLGVVYQMNAMTRNCYATKHNDEFVYDFQTPYKKCIQTTGTYSYL